MHYMLFFPDASIPANQGGNAKAILSHHGMADIADGSPSLSRVVEHGPDGGPGVLIGWGGAALCKLSEQSWREVPGCEYQVGTGLDGKVSPASLKRADHLGYDVKLGDGQAWKIPIAHAFPETYTLQEDGTVSGQLQGDFGEFFDFAYDVVLAQWFTDEAPPSFTEACKFCARALSFNYRMTYEIALTLGLFNRTACQQIMEAVCDVPAMVRMQELKKKEGQAGD